MKFFSAEGLRIQRMQKRVSQAELAAQVGLSTATICRIERGDRVPTAGELKELSDALLAMPMKPWAAFAEDEVPSEARVLRGDQQLRVEISLEKLENAGLKVSGIRRASAAETAKPGKGASVVFYVPLDGLALQPANDDSEEELSEEYPRQR